MAVDTPLFRKGAMGFNDAVVGDAGLAVKTVDVLREVFEEEALFVEEVDEGVRYCWAVFPWV